MAIVDGIDDLDIETILKNINKELKGIEKRSDKGLALAALHVKGKAQEYTPIDEGNLRASAYVISSEGTKDEGEGFGGKHAGRMSSDHQSVIRENKSLIRNLTAIIGYTAYYAVYVHEINKNYKAPGVSWKYLARALYEEKDMILKIIAKKAKL